MKSFICRSCLNPVASTGHTSVDIGASANLELVDKFCNLGDMLNVDGDADAAVEARIEVEVKGSRPRGRPKRTWREVVLKDYQACKLNWEDARS